MNLKPPPYIDLTGRLPSLRSSLTPQSKHFEAAPPIWQPAPVPDPSHPFLLAFSLWLALTAAGVAAILWL